MSTTSNIDTDSIKQSILRQRQVAKQKEEDKLNAQIQENENKVKNTIEKVIENDIKKLIELEEKQQDLKKFYNIVKEEEKIKIQEQKKEQFKSYCQSIIDKENFTPSKIAFKFFAWLLIIIGFFQFINYFGSIMDRIS